jgi:hypothetical protein
MHKQDKGITLNCFSPPVMMATFIIETTMALYTVWRYKLTRATQLIVASLFFLGLFQLSEYFVCGGWDLKASFWARVGFVAITTLPPLGLHILHVIAGRPARKLVYFGYLTMAMFIVYFTLYKSAFTGYACTGNYVIFQIGNRPAVAYALYYYGWLLTAMVLCVRWANYYLHKAKKVTDKVKLIRALLVGYLIFLVPTAVANSVSPETRRGIPSIMCGFAVLFACILTFYILPHLAPRRSVT